MNTDLVGKKVLVTGSSSGIGLGIAQALSDEGCIVALNGRNEKSLALASTNLPRSIGVVGDFTSTIDANHVVKEVVNKFDRLDILVCNVGSGRSVLPGNENIDEWNRMLSLNFLSTTNAVEAAKNYLSTSKGVIICVSSICGIEVIPKAPITYSVAKAALNAYVKGMARPLGKSGIRICAIAPGNILFKESVWASKIKDEELEVQKMLNENVSLGRLGEIQDIANIVKYLASNNAKFITGNIWVVDGGQVRQ